MATHKVYGAKRCDKIVDTIDAVLLEQEREMERRAVAGAKQLRLAQLYERETGKLFLVPSDG